MGKYRAAATVQVVWRGKPYERLTDRPLRKLPSGISGVVYQGKVYPLHRGDVIDIDEVGLSKNSCDAFVEVDDPVLYLPEASNVWSTA